MTATLVVDRTDLRRTHWVSAEPTPLAEGAVRLTVDAFALTSNNITYAAFGDAMHYWDFFPTGDTATGCIPVWGFGTVVESRCAGVTMGERYYGYFPMATDLVLEPVRVNASGFRDGAEHRRELYAVYNHYTRCSADSGYRVEREAEQALLRPLFITSFLVDDFLADNGFFGARTVVLSSASSKTAYGTAFCLAQRRGDSDAVKITGLTSVGNMGFTQGLGCYDEVLCYEEVAKLPDDVPTVYVDFSGSKAVRQSVHTHFRDRLMYSCSVGGTHWDSLGSGRDLAGPRPILFFAPSQVKKRTTDWGAVALQNRIDAAWSAFMVPVTDAHHPWLNVVRGHGPAAIKRTYEALIAGTVPPDRGNFITTAG
jgi:hypothetical protein